MKAGVETIFFYCWLTQKAQFLQLGLHIKLLGIQYFNSDLLVFWIVEIHFLRTLEKAEF